MNYLPNELRLNIFRHFDLATALTYLRLGNISDNELINKFLKFDVSIKVEYFGMGFLTIELTDLKTKKVAMTWNVIEMEVNRTRIRQLDSTGKSQYHTTIVNTRFSDSSFPIVGRIFSKPMFRVKKLYLNFSNFQGFVNFGKIIDELEELHLFDCNDIMQEKIKNNFSATPRRVFFDTTEGYKNMDEPTGFGLFRNFDTTEMFFGLKDIFKTHNFYENGLEELKNRDGSLNEVGIEKLRKMLLLTRQNSNNNSEKCGYYWISSTAPGSIGNRSRDTEPTAYTSLINGVQLITFSNSDSSFGAATFGPTG